eukprot:7691218-Alexandrium_andersonii.AAC.1
MSACMSARLHASLSEVLLWPVSACAHSMAGRRACESASAERSQATERVQWEGGVSSSVASERSWQRRLKASASEAQARTDRRAFIPTLVRTA